MKTPGQLAYEEDVRLYPRHDDNTPRKAWEELPNVAKRNWERFYEVGGLQVEA